MSLLSVVLLSALVLMAAYWTYGPVLSRLLQLDPKAETPAVRLRDDVDYVPIEPKFLLTQHFSAIAAAGPIVGPILAGAMFGWAPALLWILIGSVLIGGVHDMTSLVASIRHQARSIADVVREHMTPRSYLLFLAFIWLALVYIVVAFTDITAASFVGALQLENGDTVTGAGIATSSLLYLALPIVMGLVLRYTRMPLSLATVIFLPLVAVSIWAGQYAPLDLEKLLGVDVAVAQRVWCVVLLIYCFIASVIPMWLLLQPRGHLGGFFLFFALGGGALGLIFGGKPVAYPAFIGWESLQGQPLFPLLFVTIACGACSGFHSMIASGTTSKQLRRETDARLVGYGTMLMEGMVAVVSLACVMMLSADHELITGPGNPKPNLLYAQGIGSFLAVLGIPASFGVSFGLMAFTTFVYDTLDVCTRLGRYILQELTGWNGRLGRLVCTAATAAVPLIFLMRQPIQGGKVTPTWRVFWDLFGASNQLLAALTLIGVTVWLWQTRRARWVWLVTGLPAVLMYTMSTWALGRIIYLTYAKTGIGLDLVAWVAVVLLALAALMLVEAVLVVLGSAGPPARRGAPALASA
ncbi:MAG: carbon starvation protein A [Pirellulales bacterium]|nr:carbon starvation protein A [Pirellulales bacterium]